jgi:hypothetical protein
VADGGRRAPGCGAVLTTAQSRLFEEYLLRANIPYQAGSSVFERTGGPGRAGAPAAAAQPQRRRGAGARDQQAGARDRRKTVRSCANRRASGLTLWQAAQACPRSAFAARAGSAVAAWWEGMRAHGRLTLGNQMQGVIDESRLADHYEKEPNERLEPRSELQRTGLPPMLHPAAGGRRRRPNEPQSFSAMPRWKGDTQGETWTTGCSR